MRNDIFKKSYIKNSQTREVNQELFTMLLTTSIDGAIEFDGKDIFVCDDDKKYTWQEFWKKYKDLKAGKGENLGGRG